VKLVDTSVWNDYFRGVVTPQSDKLDTLLGVAQVLTGDLALTGLLSRLVGEDIALQSAKDLPKTQNSRGNASVDHRYADRDELHREGTLIAQRVERAF
jgi:hypothetical protein